jgi:hypothetical protein
MTPAPWYIAGPLLGLLIVLFAHGRQQAVRRAWRVHRFGPSDRTPTSLRSLNLSRRRSGRWRRSLSRRIDMMQRRRLI